MKLSIILQKVLPVLRQTKNYARIVGVILFAIGLFGFAFRSGDSLPDKYLVGALILGFWGIVSGLLDGGVRNDVATEVVASDAVESKPEPETAADATVETSNDQSHESTQI